MTGICDKCRRAPCNIRMDGLRVCDLYEGGETNYERLFGTPERAARFLFDYTRCPRHECDNCFAEPYCNCGFVVDNHRPILEWLESEGE